MHPSTTTRDRALEATLDVLGDLFGPPDGWPVRVRLWDGSEYGNRSPLPGTVVLEHPWSLRRLLWPPTPANMGAAYVFGDIDLQGDVEAMLAALESLNPRRTLSLGRTLALATKLRQLPAPPKRHDPCAASIDGELHSPERDRQAVCHHYDVSNAFYALWLDRRMQYSCAYFDEACQTLDDAQEAKLDLICRKLQLAPGERLLDIGCGWGGLVRHAAERYGAFATGITVSQPQADLANERIAQAHLAERAEVRIADYRDIAGPFDKLVSVGMAEHVGEERLGEYFRRAFDALRPGGLFLHHAIATAWWNQPSPAKDGFVRAYVFPDGELVPISRTLVAAEAAGFEVRDVECLREHYARTLRHWVRNLERERDRALEHVGEATYRVWRLYMAGSAMAFHKGEITVYQTLLHKPTGGPSGLPLTRAGWYRD